MMEEKKERLNTMPKTIKNVLSLFDGISGGQLALKKAGIKVTNYYASEIDKFAIEVAQSNFPKTIQLGDITKIKAEDLPKIDLIIGGSPCQGFSVGGKRLNFDDPRSKLFFDYARLIATCKPKYFLLENVRMKKDCKEAISNILGVEALEINSKLLSGQLRNRLYWTNIPLKSLPKDKGITLESILESGYTDREKSLCVTARYGNGTTLNRYASKAMRQVVFPTKKARASYLKRKREIYLGDYKPGKDIPFRLLTPVEVERLQNFPDNYTAQVSKTQRLKALGNAWTVNVVAHLLKGIK